MRLDGLRIDSRKQRIDFAANLHMLDAALLEDVRQHVAARAIHAVDGKLEVCFRDLVQVGELADSFNVGRLEIGLLDFRSFALRHGSVVDIPFNLLDDGRRCRSAIRGLELHSIPSDGLWLEVIMIPPAVFRLLTRIGQRRSGRVII